MSERADIRIDLSGTKPSDLADEIGETIASSVVWKRDGILEHQVSTQEEYQYCFRNEPGGERPRTALCLAGNAETLTVACVVPIDRDVELSDDQHDAIVTEFYSEVLYPSTEGTAVAVVLQTG